MCQPSMTEDHCLAVAPKPLCARSSVKFTLSGKSQVLGPYCLCKVYIQTTETPLLDFLSIPSSPLSSIRPFLFIDFSYPFFLPSTPHLDISSFLPFTILHILPLHLHTPSSFLSSLTFLIDYLPFMPSIPAVINLVSLVVTNKSRVCYQLRLSSIPLASNFLGSASGISDHAYCLAAVHPRA